MPARCHQYLRPSGSWTDSADRAASGEHRSPGHTATGAATMLPDSRSALIRAAHRALSLVHTPSLAPPSCMNRNTTMSYASSNDHHTHADPGAPVVPTPLCSMRKQRRDRRVIQPSALPCRHAQDAEAERRAADGPHLPSAVQHLCGRWLTWHRLHAGWSTAAVARAVGIRATDLTRLELGRSDPRIVTDAIRTRLAACLTDARQPHPWMEAVILGACGTLSALTPSVLAAMVADLASGCAQVPFWHTAARPNHP